MHIKISQQNIEFECKQDETFLDAAKRQGITLPNSCRNGDCHLCESTLLCGRALKINQGITISGEADGSQRILLCQGKPETDCELDTGAAITAEQLPLKEIVCQVKQIENLPQSIFRVVLLLPAGNWGKFYAGQYLAIHLPEKEEPSFFSIASAPGQREIELHIQVDPQYNTADRIIAHLKQNTTVNVSLPFGKACLSQLPDRPLMLIVAGTGFAQAKSIIEYLFQSGFKQQIHLYWGSPTAEELYLRSMAESWQQQHPNFTFKAIAADTDDNQWSGHHEQLYQAVIADEKTLSDYEVYASGSPVMVYATMDALAEQGLKLSQFHSDVLEYAPRPAT